MKNCYLIHSLYFYQNFFQMIFSLLLDLNFLKMVLSSQDLLYLFSVNLSCLIFWSLNFYFNQTIFCSYCFFQNLLLKISLISWNPNVRSQFLCHFTIQIYKFSNPFNEKLGQKMLKILRFKILRSYRQFHQLMICYYKRITFNIILFILNLT